MSSRCRNEYLIGLIEFPIEMVDVEEQHLALIFVLELLEYARLPAIRQILLRFQILIEEPLFIWNTQEVKNVNNHVEMREQKHLGEVCRKFFIVLFNSRPEFRLRLAQRFRIEL